MTIPKPDKFPLFATVPQNYDNGQANIVEPLDAQKRIGWSPDELPACNIMNWLHAYTMNWLQYLHQESLTKNTFKTTGHLSSTGTTTIDMGGVSKMKVTAVSLRVEYNDGSNFICLAPHKNGSSEINFYFQTGSTHDELVIKHIGGTIFNNAAYSLIVCYED